MEEEKKIYIERKDGIKYYRKAKNKENVAKRVTIRLYDDDVLNLKKIAEKKDIKYFTLIRKILQDYIEKNKEV